eukprot:g33656.t1
MLAGKDLARGLALGRRVLLDVLAAGLPTAVEFLDPLVAPYIEDVVAYGSIGARTVESPVHRQLAASLTMPIGFKNSRSGDIQSAVNAAVAASSPQKRLSTDPRGRVQIEQAIGNPDVHIILRGSEDGPNFGETFVAEAKERLAQAGFRGSQILIDCSHGNSGKKYEGEVVACHSVAEQVSSGNTAIGGVLIESFLVAGNQKLEPGVTKVEDLQYGCSVTDSCLDFNMTQELLQDLRRSVLARRARVEETWKGTPEAWKKVAEDAYEGLTSCSGFRNECADGSSCYTDAGDYYTNEIAGARLIGKGFLKGAGDVAGGIIGLIISLLVLCGALYVLVRLLQSLVMGQAKKVIMKGTKMNDYLAILVGFLITILVQSSSVTTSALTPLVGIGVLPVHKMLPMTLGANIGTTITSVLAAFAVMKFNSIQIAFCHLLFNIIGICVWFPAPIMRRVIVKAACTLGFYASYWRLVPLIYILVMFVAVPGLSLAISLLYGASVAGGIVLTLLALSGVAGFVFWWVRLGGCYKVVSQEEREARKAEMEEEMGTTETKVVAVVPSEAWNP